jgi:hypothetical protein
VTVFKGITNERSGAVYQKQITRANTPKKEFLIE